MTGNLNENHSPHNFQTLADISGKVKFSENSQPYSYYRYSCSIERINLEAYSCVGCVVLRGCVCVCVCGCTLLF